MKVSDIDAMIDAQFDYERKRILVYHGEEAEPDCVYQFVTRDALRDISGVTGIRARLLGTGGYATAQIEYKGCVFQAPSGRAD